MTEEDIKPISSLRPIIFLDIDGVLNCTKHNKQIHFEASHLKRLKAIIEKTNALIVLSTFWRHFHEYVTYVFHRHGIDVVSCMLPLPMGATRGKQTTKKFLHYHRLKQEGDNSSEEQSMIGRSADDDAEYSSRAEEIEAWLQTYGEQYLGGGGETIEGGDDTSTGYDWHNDDWKYIILDDRPSAAKPDTPLFDRFVHTTTEEGITDDEVDWAIELLRCGPKDASTHRMPNLEVANLENIFSHEQFNISPDLAVLLTPENSPTKKSISKTSPKQQQEKNQSKQEESPSVMIDGNDTDEILNSSHYNEYESEVLAAMCDYSNVCPTLVALMQPPMEDCPLPKMMKSFEEEKKTSFDDTEDELIHDEDDDTEETDCNSLPDQEVGSSFDSLTDNNIQNDPPIPPRSSPPMSVFHKFSPTFYEHNDEEDNNNDIGIDDLGQRWKSSFSGAVGAPPLVTNDDDSDGK